MQNFKKKSPSYLFSIDLQSYDPFSQIKTPVGFFCKICQSLKKHMDDHRGKFRNSWKKFISANIFKIYLSDMGLEENKYSIENTQISGGKISSACDPKQIFGNKLFNKAIKKAQYVNLCTYFTFHVYYSERINGTTLEESFIYQYHSNTDAVDSYARISKGIKTLLDKIYELIIPTGRPKFFYNLGGSQKNTRYKRSRKKNIRKKNIRKKNTLRKSTRKKNTRKKNTRKRYTKRK